MIKWKPWYNSGSIILPSLSDCTSSSFSSSASSTDNWRVGHAVLPRLGCHMTGNNKWLFKHQMIEFFVVVVHKKLQAYSSLVVGGAGKGQRQTHAGHQLSFFIKRLLFFILFICSCERTVSPKQNPASKPFTFFTFWMSLTSTKRQKD